ncbi:MAG: hypothetical protein WC803_11280 [Sphingomonas sp.]|jgi:hypothetical protein
MSEVDRQIAMARDVLERSSASYRSGPARKQRVNEVGRRLTRIAAANGAIMMAAILIGLFMPIGMFGALAAMVLMIAATLLLALAPAAPPPSPEKLRTTPIQSLPARTGRWLNSQRAALPAPAMSLIDQIGLRLDTLQPQLATLAENDPAAAEVRKLVGEQLPEFIKGYTRVPQNLRNVERNGKTPDTQLVEGLALIEGQIGDMTAQLAQGDLDQLETRGRYLEIKYRSDGVDSAL